MRIHPILLPTALDRHPYLGSTLEFPARAAAPESTARAFETRLRGRPARGGSRGQRHSQARFDDPGARPLPEERLGGEAVSLPSRTAREIAVEEHSDGDRGAARREEDDPERRHVHVEAKGDEGGDAENDPHAQKEGSSQEDSSREKKQGNDRGPDDMEGPPRPIGSTFERSEEGASLEESSVVGAQVDGEIKRREHGHESGVCG